MALSKRLLTLATGTAVAAMVAFSPLSLRAQETASTDPALTAAAQKAFKGIADGDADVLRPLVLRKYALKLNADELRPTQTGPKLAVAFDGNVRVMRSNDKTAVVQANMFAPSSNDVPKGEATKLTLFMVKSKDGWQIDAPDKKQSDSDATINGGWFHPGAFTFCPNKGLEYLGSHFSNKLNCQSTAICR
jgi:hypothetical protein